MECAIRRLALFVLGCCALLQPRLVAAHAVTVDGSSSEWLVRPPMNDDQSIIARSATGSGELIWRDRTGDTVADAEAAELTRFHVTGTATDLFLLARVPNYTGSQQVQIQIAIDLDQVPGSGVGDFTGGADTKVSPNAEWEFLVQTLFYGTDSCRVLNASNQNAGFPPCALGADGVEIGVPWSTLGLAGPPATPIRFSVAVFRGTIANAVVEVDGGSGSDALDVMSNYGNPGYAPATGTSAEVADGQLDYYVDAWFKADGSVYAPVVIDRFNVSPATSGSDEWLVLRNVSPYTLNLSGYKVGDAEVPDDAEAMGALTGLGSLAAGATFAVARNGTAYQTHLGSAPGAEFVASSGLIPNTTAYSAWGTVGVISFSDTGDEIVLLDSNNTIVDVVPYNAGSYSLVASLNLGANAPAYRADSSVDTDQPSDFITTTQCGPATACAPCYGCSLNVCIALAVGASCNDGTVCNGLEQCDGAGTCNSGTPLACDDGNPCTSNACNATTGCSFPAATTTVCNDGNDCTTSDECDAQGACIGAPIVCPPYNECVDASTSRAFFAGTCTAAECDYTSADTSCGAGCNAASGLCNDDPCDGVECAEPPSQCHLAQGLCDNGSCDYELAQTGTPCDDGDPCTLQDVCDAGTCAGTALACDRGPASGCIDDMVVVYEATGTCTEGTCNYGVTAYECSFGCNPEGPACNVDPCDGVVCDTPPSSCFGASGTCEAGVCVYPVGPASSCDDGDPCTSGDTCQEDGACKGVEVSCEDELTCLDTSTSRSRTGGYCNFGRCAWAEATLACSAGCDAVTGACNEDLCDGVVCNTPPSGCHASTGSCVEGTCAYELVLAGTSCDDGDACTSADACDVSGACAGSPVVCEDRVSCLDATTSRAAKSGVCVEGECEYVNTDTTCEAGCDSASGYCREDPCAADPNAAGCLPRHEKAKPSGCAAAGGPMETLTLLALLLVRRRRRVR